jgi:hypothetical protein
MRGAVLRSTALPVSVDPVNDILAKPGWEVIQDPLDNVKTSRARMRKAQNPQFITTRQDGEDTGWE